MDYSQITIGGYPIDDSFFGEFLDSIFRIRESLPLDIRGQYYVNGYIIAKELFDILDQWSQEGYLAKCSINEICGLVAKSVGLCCGEFDFDMLWMDTIVNNELRLLNVQNLLPERDKDVLPPSQLSIDTPPAPSVVRLAARVAQDIERGAAEQSLLAGKQLTIRESEILGL